MFADWPEEEDEGALRRRVWHRSDVLLGALAILLGFLALVLLSLLVAVVTGTTRGHGADLPGTLITLGFESLLGVTVLLLAARRSLPLRQLGLRRLPAGGLATAALVGSYATFVLYQVGLNALARTGIDVSALDKGNPLPTGPSTGPVTWVLLGFAVVVVAPLAEELFFRGFVFRAVAGVLPLWAAYLVSGFTFAAFHLNPSVLLPFTVVGAFFAWSYWKSGSLWTSITAHAIVNGASFVFTVMGMIR